MSNDKKILFLTNIPSPYRVDFFGELAKYCELTVLYELPAAGDRDASWKGDACSCKRISGFREIYLKPIFKLTSSAWCPSFKKYLKKEKYDIVVVGMYSSPTGMHAIHYLRKKKIPYILNCDGGFAAESEKPWKRRLKTFFISGAGVWLSSAKIADDYLVYYGADRKRIYRFPFTSIYDKDIIEMPWTEQEKQESRKKLGLNTENMILAVGSFIPRKGFDILLEAAALLEDAYHIYLVGGTCTDEYKELIARHGLKRIHTIPFQSTPILREYYRAADLFVLPTREDIWGLVVNEAMAAGLPVITTDRCLAGLELLEDQRCIVPAEDSKLLAGAIKRMMEQRSLRYQTAECNLKKIRSYSLENMARVHMEIFEHA